MLRPVYLAPVYNKFGLFCKKAEMDDEESLETPICIETSQIESKDEDEDGILPPVPKPNKSFVSQRERK
jgi:hypothetical protein